MSNKLDQLIEHSKDDRYMKYEMVGSEIREAVADHKKKFDKLVKALEDVSKVLTVPAAEYVPAIGDAFKIIDQALKDNHGY